MFCLKCGEAIPDNSERCPLCGASLKENATQQTIIYASQKESQQTPINSKQHGKLSKKALLAIAVVACLIIIILVVLSVSKANLKKSLTKEWYDVEDSIIKVLDIDDDEIEYRLETGYSFLDSTLGSYDWKVVSGNKIKIKRFGDEYETYVVELNDEKDVLTISPAITSTDSSETWYHID